MNLIEYTLSIFLIVLCSVASLLSWVLILQSQKIRAKLLLAEEDVHILRRRVLDLHYDLQIKAQKQIQERSKDNKQKMIEAISDPKTLRKIFSVLLMIKTWQLNPWRLFLLCVA